MDPLAIGFEPEARGSIDVALHARRAEEIKGDLVVLRRAKGILHLTGFELEREVVRFLNDELGIRARHESGNREDFWLLDDASGEEWCLGEVKAAESRTIERPELSKVDSHRREAGRAPDFPALLVASTFRGREVVDRRDEAIPPNIISRAAEDHILIVRTLDLIRMKQKALMGNDEAARLTSEIRAGSGWFKVDADLSIAVDRG